jgi:lysophospholipase L1-like esterase
MTSRFVPPFYDVGSGIKPPSGAKLFFFEVDGVTPKNTFSDQLTVPTANENPVIADSNGVFGDIFINGKYKIELKDADLSQIYGLTSIVEITEAFSDQITTTELIAGTAIYAADVVVNTVGFTTSGTGGAPWKQNGTTGVAVSQTPAQLGDALFNDGNGNQWSLVSAGDLDARVLGGFASADSNAVLVACAVHTEKTNNRIIVEENLISTDNQKVFSNSVFVGKGSIAGLYRKQVINEKMSNPAFFNSYIPESQKSRVLNSTPKVVLVGDSISTYAANSSARQCMITDDLQNLCVKEFGACDFVNRAVAGQTYESFDGIPSGASGVDWYINVLKPWMDYIQDESPDIVFLSFGMNDQSSIDTDALISITNKLEAFNKPPAIIFLTNLNPSKSGSKANLFDTRSEQEGRDYAAGFTRTFAEYYGYGLIDVHRQHSIIRDGLDVVGGALGLRETINPIADVITGAIECYNFKMGVTFNESLMTDSSAVYHDFSFEVTGKSKVRVRNAGGFYRFVVYYGSDNGASNNIEIFNSLESVGAGDRKMSFELVAGKFTVYREDDDLGANTAPIAVLKIIRGGGLFFPSIVTTATGSLVRSTFDYSNGYICTPKVSDSDLWGYLDDPKNIGDWGGSAWNHPSTRVSEYVYKPLLSTVELKTLSGRAANIGDMLFTSGALTSNTTAPTGAPYNYSVNLSDTINQQVVFSSKKSVLFTDVLIRYISDNTGGTDIVFDLSIINQKDLTVGERVNISSVTQSLDNTSSGIVTTKRLTTQLKTLNLGDEINLWRNAASASDDYGEFKLLSIDFI